jgi:hypothetical protein
MPTVASARTSLFVPELDRLHVAVRASVAIEVASGFFVRFRDTRHENMLA